jgi:hypothetical protein
VTGARALVAAALLAGCGGKSKGPPPVQPPGPMPIAGLDQLERGDSPGEVQVLFPGATVEGDDLWLEEATVEGRPASVGFHFQDGGLRGATVAFAAPCDQLDAIAGALDQRLGKRTSAEEGIAAWSKARWDIALYCAQAEEGDWLRLDVRPGADF